MDTELLREPIADPAPAAGGGDHCTATLCLRQPLSFRTDAVPSPARLAGGRDGVPSMMSLGDPGWRGHYSALQVVSMWRLTSSHRWGRDNGGDWEGVSMGQTGAGSHHSCPQFIARTRQLESQLLSALLWKDLPSCCYPCPRARRRACGLPRPVLLGGCRGGECGRAPQPRPALALPWVGYAPEGQGQFLSIVAPSQLCPCSSPCPSGAGAAAPSVAGPGNRTLTCFPDTLHPAL